jgi:hypothetical protein
MLNFTLTFDGQLPSGSKGAKIEEKQAIRRKLHPQLRAWWETGPMAQTLRQMDQTMYQTFIMSQLTNLTGFTFIPLVTKWLQVVCELDILMLKPEEPGRFIKNDGDLDNRLKVLFDALRMPKDKDELPRGDRPTDEERPHFYCLLEDDALITKVTLRADRLLVTGSDPDAVRVIIGVSIRATHLTTGNFPIGT